MAQVITKTQKLIAVFVPEAFHRELKIEAAKQSKRMWEVLVIKKK